MSACPCLRVTPWAAPSHAALRIRPLFAKVCLGGDRLSGEEEERKSCVRLTEINWLCGGVSYLPLPPEVVT